MKATMFCLNMHRSTPPLCPLITNYKMKKEQVRIANVYNNDFSYNEQSRKN